MIIKNDIKVSIIVLSFNQEKYIKETLESIVSQEHSFKYELIVCDDASKDTTPTIIEEYGTIYKEIKPELRKTNVGVINNYFDAISKCKGEFIMVCGGDDYWLPDKISTQIDFMQNHPQVGLCYGDAITIDENGKAIGKLTGKEVNSFENLIQSNYITACSVCIRKSLLNIYISEVKPIEKTWKMEDYPIVLWFAVHSEIYYLKKELVAYRIIENSISHQKDLHKQLEFIKSIYDIKYYFCKTYINESSINKYLDITDYYLVQMRLSIIKKYNVRQSIRMYRKNFITYFKNNKFKLKGWGWFLAPKLVSRLTFKRETSIKKDNKSLRNTK